jgi:hypothetical protein
MLSEALKGAVAPNQLALPRRMLSLLSEGGIASTADLARRLGVSEGLIGMMAEEMTRRGYLARMDGCHGGCGGCHAASSCAASPSGTAPEATSGALLLLTSKGRQAAAGE